MEAGWTDASAVESIPLEAAGAEPFVLFAGRPTAERAADARAGRIVPVFLLKLAVQNDRFCNVTHETDVLSAEKPILSLRNLYRA